MCIFNCKRRNVVSDVTHTVCHVIIIIRTISLEPICQGLQGRSRSYLHKGQAIQVKRNTLLNHELCTA